MVESGALDPTTPKSLYLPWGPEPCSSYCVDPTFQSVYIILLRV